MPTAGQLTLSKGEVLMYLDLARLNRREAASMAGVARSTFFNAMRRHRVRAPKPQAKLSIQEVRRIRVLLEKHTRADVAVMYCVHPRTIDKLATKATWYSVC